MKIVRIEVFQLTLPLHKPFNMSGGRTYYDLDDTIVAVHTDEGIVGWGESCPWGPIYLPQFSRGIRAGIEELAPSIIGEDPLQIEKLNHRMDHALLGHEYVKSAIDYALWDILGKYTGLPVCDLLGGRFDGDLRISLGISTDTPDAMVKDIAEKRAEGYNVFSFKLGGGDAALDIDRVNAILADGAPADRFHADCNRGQTVSDAMRIMHNVPVADLVLEQPCRTYEECLTLRQNINQPIMLDELITTPQELMRAIADGCCQAVNIKISRVGGITKARRLRDLSIYGGLLMSIQETGGAEITTAGAVHLARSTPPEFLHSVIDIRDYSALETCEGGPEKRNGRLFGNNEPGLGVTPKLDVLGEPVAVYQ